MKTVTIGLHVDEFAAMDREPAAITAKLPGVAVRFVRDLPPHKLKDHPSLSVYVFDIGGLCLTDHSGERRLDFCKHVNTLADERPNTLFVPWSSMTRDYLRTALQMLTDEWDSGDVATEDIKFADRPNVSLPYKRDEEKLFGYSSDEHFADAIRRWVTL